MEKTTVLVMYKTVLKTLQFQSRVMGSKIILPKDVSATHLVVEAISETTKINIETVINEIHHGYGVYGGITEWECDYRTHCPSLPFRPTAGVTEDDSVFHLAEILDKPLKEWFNEYKKGNIIKLLEISR